MGLSWGLGGRELYLASNLKDQSTAHNVSLLWQYSGIEGGQIASFWLRASLVLETGSGANLHGENRMEKSLVLNPVPNLNSHVRFEICDSEIP